MAALVPFKPITSQLTLSDPPQCHLPQEARPAHHTHHWAFIWPPPAAHAGCLPHSLESPRGPHLYPLLLPSLEGVRPGLLGVLSEKDMEFMATWPCLDLVCAHTLC